METRTFRTKGGFEVTLYSSSDHPTNHLYVGEPSKGYNACAMMSSMSSSYSCPVGTLKGDRKSQYSWQWTWNYEPLHEVRAKHISQDRVRENIQRTEVAEQQNCVMCGMSAASHGPGLIHSHTSPEPDFA